MVCLKLSRLFSRLLFLCLIPWHLEAGARVYYVHADHVGTPQVLTDEDQRVIWQARYQPFGEALVDENPDGDREALVFNLRFPGQYHDVNTGLHYNYFRDYDPRLGRYIQSDPIGLKGGLNTYGYGNQNPIFYMDPDGRLAVQAVNAAVGAVLGGYAAYRGGGAAGSIFKGAIMGATTNLVSGKATFNAFMSFVSAVGTQVTTPCFDGFNHSQLAAATALGAYGLGDRIWQPNLFSNSSVIAHAMTTQILGNSIVERL